MIWDKRNEFSFGAELYDEVCSTLAGVPIEVMLPGEFPGDGKPKPIQIPAPAVWATEIDGVKYVTLEKLVEFKLASGISAPDRLKDLADVQELIKARPLRREFAERLDPYVSEEFLELLEAVEKSNPPEKSAAPSASRN